MICDIIVKIFIVQVSVLSLCFSFNLQSKPSLFTVTSYTKLRPERILFSRSVSFLKQYEGSDSDGSISQNSNNSTGIHTSLLFTDEECYDLCEVDEDSKAEDGILSLTPTTPTTKVQQNVSMVHLDARHHVTMNAASYASASAPRKSKKSVEQVMRNIELRWHIDEHKDNCDIDDVSTCSEACDECEGKGVMDCEFCNGTGWIDFGEQTAGTIGEKLVKKKWWGTRHRVSCLQRR